MAQTAYFRRKARKLSPGDDKIHKVVIHEDRVCLDLSAEATPGGHTGGHEDAERQGSGRNNESPDPSSASFQRYDWTPHQSVSNLFFRGSVDPSCRLLTNKPAQIEEEGNECSFLQASKGATKFWWLIWESFFTSWKAMKTKGSAALSYIYCILSYIYCILLSFI